MSDAIDVYIERFLKNWAARHRPSKDGRARLLSEASRPPSEDPTPISRFFSTYSNRWSSPGEQLYAQRHWQLIEPFAQSMNWSFHLVTQQKLVQ